MSVKTSNSITANLQFAITYSDDVSRQLASELGESLGLEPLNISNLNKSTIKDLDFLLCLKNDVLSLKDVATETEIVVDFSRVNKSRLSKKLQLARAAGFKSKSFKSASVKSANVLTILDATAGMGRDAYTLAALGSKVTMIEQSKVIAALLKNGMTRQEQIESEIIKSMTLHEGNAVELIPSLEAHDVIYLDPMYADRAKQALPKKEMQIFRKLLGHDDDVDELLEIALQHAKKRVVVKRHRTAKPLLDMKPHAELVGKQTRFDIYLT